MELTEAIVGRRTIRQYTQQNVDESTLRKLIDAATYAPSAVNEQPWAFTVVRDRAILDRISQSAKTHMSETMPASAASDHLHGHVNDPDFHIFYDAPVLILISAVAAGTWIVEDCALAAENLMLAAYGAQLGSGWIGLAQSYLNTPAGKQALGSPGAWVAVAPIIVGHPLAANPRVSRREPVVHWVGGGQ